MPETRIDLYEFLRDLTCEDGCRVVMEDVGFHVAGNAASASVAFGKQVERIETILACLRVPLEKVRPHAWMKTVIAGKAPKERTARKKAIRDVVLRLFPNAGGAKLKLDYADALGILAHMLGRR
jgi:hypothetical protein